MRPCPDIDTLLEDPRAFAPHLETCGACRGVGALLDLRHERMASADDACERAELGIALLHEGTLPAAERVALVEHIESCSLCNEVATRMLALPAVDALPVPSDARWRRAAIGLGITTLAALAAVMLLLLTRPRIEPLPVAAAPERIEARDRPASAQRAPVPSVGVERPPPVLTVVPKVEFPLPGPPTRSPVKDPFVGSQTTSQAKPHDDSESEVMNPWADTGFLSVICNPVCESVSVKGKKLGPSPIVRHVLPVGSHVVTARRGSKVRTATMTIKKGETSMLRVQMGVDVGF